MKKPNIGQNVSLGTDIDCINVIKPHARITIHHRTTGSIEFLIHKRSENGLSVWIHNIAVGVSINIYSPEENSFYSANMFDKVPMVATDVRIALFYQIIKQIVLDENDTTDLTLIYSNEFP